ncbi:substrate-binding domain-containing protein [Tengunoibacter tsumagoiensis]|uniref:HTH gntR-type domain-containing protein n=1 Tax=Tengunoibacter tsumagoiensis TaxID=2014871 RepID=A0A402A1F3_9CHLR|nr:substrate-binding domain-containing protein [Tengunoibacter tsumagoiensis]GCE12886.1 hypothetical protein KTT_27450 [Tengunoibacter tsumagoiensis]
MVMRVPRLVRSDSKIEHLCTRLREIASAQGPNTRLPTVDELCLLLSTSRVTLTEVLKQLESQQVLYRQHSKGIFVSPYIHRKNIGIVLNSTLFMARGASPFWGMLWGLFAQEARKREMQGNLLHSFYGAFQGETQIELPEECQQMILAQRFQGVLTIGLSVQENEWILDQGVPCVAFAGGCPWVVALDQLQFVRMAIRSMAQQNCRSLEFWLHSSYGENDPDLVEQLDGIQANQGLIFDSVQLRIGHERPTLQEQGYQMAMEVFGQTKKPHPDGIILLDDMMTDGVLAAFQVLGIHTGQDVTIVTHSNLNSMLLFTALPGITVLEFDPTETVQAMFTLLDTLMMGQTPALSPVRISPRFRERI